MPFANRLNNVETSAIRELFKLLGKPGIISLAGGFPDSALFDIEGIRAGSQRALDLLGKTLIAPGDKVIVEGPTFLAPIQCFRLYGADLIGAPTDANGVDTGALEMLIAEHRPQLVYLIPTFGNPSGATLSLARRRQGLGVG